MDCGHAIAWASVPRHSLHLLQVRQPPLGGQLTTPDCQFIGYNPDRHLGLVTSTWLHTARHSAYARLMHPATFTQTHRAVMDELLRVRGLQPDIVAAQNGEVIAWSLWEGEHRRILHYIWVAQPIRRCGFASSIARRMGLDRSTVMSHWTDSAERCMQSSRVRQLLCAANSPHVRFCPTLAVTPDAFCAM